jgi:hypothetical protein
MIGVPVSVDQELDRLRVNSLQRVFNASFGDTKASVNEEFPFRTIEDGDVSTGTFNECDIAAQCARRHLCGSSRLDHSGDDSAVAGPY